jgi:5'-nucleotidase / UDP-sugar diphosphatase
MKNRLQMAILTLALLACAWAGQAQERPVKLVIFHTNDIHGRIETFPRIATIVARERQINPNVLLLGAGDNFSGNPVVDQYDPKGWPILELFNQLGYDAMTLGNHEFDYGQEILKKHLAAASYRVVCANITAGAGAIIPQPAASTVLRTKGGLNVVVVGLIQTDKNTGLPDTHPARLAGLTFSDGLAKAREYHDLKGKNDVFICISHLGVDQDMLLAQALPELDCIVGGHSHTIIDNPQLVNGVLVTQTGSSAHSLGRIEITLQGGKVVDKRGLLIPLDEDKKVRDMVVAYGDNPSLNRILHKADTALAGKDEIGCLMADAVREIHHLDLALLNNGGIRANILPQTILVKDVYQIDPFSNAVVVINMSAAEIRSLIGGAFNRRSEPDMQIAGGEYTVFTDAAGKMTKLEVTGPDGKALDDARTYKVGLSSYIASAYTFAHKDPGTSLFSSTSDALLKYIEQQKPALQKYKGLVRVHVKPAQ